MSLSLPITNRCRKYGYLVWPKRQDEEVESVLRRQENIRVIFQSKDLGEKRIDWKYRRISLGPSQTQGLDDTVCTFNVTYQSDRTLNITCDYVCLCSPLGSFCSPFVGRLQEGEICQSWLIQ